MEIDSRLYDDCKNCKGTGKVPSRFGMEPCKSCRGDGILPKNKKDPSWGPKP